MRELPEGMVQGAQTRVVRTILTMNPRLARRMAGTPDVDEAPLDPNLQLLLRAKAFTGEGGFAAQGSVAAARRYFRFMSRQLLTRPEPAVADTRDLVVPASPQPIPVRVYRPAPAPERLPAIVYFHGGGFCVGDLDTHDALCRRLANGVHALVVSVDYRLAPEHPAPAASEDAEAAARWVLEHAESLGVDAARIAVAGDSAGGNLACVVGSRVEGLCYQLLLYPVVQPGLITPSMTRFAEGYGLDRVDVDFFMSHFLTEVATADPRVAPLRSPELHRCPPTRLMLAGFDVLRDEGRHLGEALRAAGVDVTTVTYGSLTHGFAQMTWSGACRDALDAGVAALRRALQG